MQSALHHLRTRRLAEVIEQSDLQPGESFPCPYLAGRSARQVAVLPPGLPPGLYHSLMDLNFRRLGQVYYRPACVGCQDCRSLRVTVAEFRPNRSQRRCWARNRDVAVEVNAPHPSREKHELYRRYLATRHDGQMSGSWEEFTGFLYVAPASTIEVSLRVEGQLLGAGLVDIEPQAMSAVYFYFDPDQEVRGPGVLSVLWMIDECRRRGIPYLYLGYYVRDSKTMMHKARYRPAELLSPGLDWRSLDTFQEVPAHEQTGASPSGAAGPGTPS